jgi:hypothetical protein
MVWCRWCVQLKRTEVYRRVFAMSTRNWREHCVMPLRFCAVVGSYKDYVLFVV